MSNSEILKSWVGKTITTISVAKDAVVNPQSVYKDRSDIITFRFSDGEEYRMYYEQDCCASCNIEEIDGNWDDLTGVPLKVAEENTNAFDPDPEGHGSCTWTFYLFGTAKGWVHLRWFGSSNGYYSESVTIKRIDKNE